MYLESISVSISVSVVSVLVYLVVSGFTFTASPVGPTDAPFLMFIPVFFISSDGSEDDADHDVEMLTQQLNTIAEETNTDPSS